MCAPVGLYCWLRLPTQSSVHRDVTDVSRAIVVCAKNAAVVSLIRFFLALAARAQGLRHLCMQLLASNDCIIRPHRTHPIDAAYCYKRRAWSVCSEHR